MKDNMKRFFFVICFMIVSMGFAQQAVHLQPAFDQMMGVNVTYKDPLGRLSMAGMVREFHVWSWNQPKQDVEDWNPQQHIDFGQYYSNLDALGITVIPVLQQTPTWLMRPGMNDQSQPLNNDLLKGKAAGFTKQAAFIKRFAETFTPSGLRYIENWNEPDKDWFGPLATFKPGEFAAMCSADYDALQTISSDESLNQSPVKLVMGGLAYPSFIYLSTFQMWGQLNRQDNKIPIDVINLHHYSNSAPEHTSPINGISPEEDHLREKMSEFVQFRNLKMPEKEIWVSEFGYDTWTGSTQGVIAIPGQSAEETQAQWLVRSFLALAAAGVDRAVLFAMSDEGDPKIRYNTSGLLSHRDGETLPKVSWYYVSALRNILRGMHFSDEITTGDPEIMIYKFSDEQNQRVVYALWCPTGKGKRVSYSFKGQGQTDVKIVSLVNGSISGESKVISAIDNSLKLEVSETPVFVVTGNVDVKMPQIKRIPLKSEMLIGPAEVSGIIDEQNQGDPFDGTFKENKSATGWTNNTALPLEAIIDLKSNLPVKGIYLKDTYNEGFVDVYYQDQAGEWKQIIHDPMRRYFVWDPYFFKTPLNTGKLKVVLEGKTEIKTSCLGEIMVYVEE
jgi:hypothetical protein